ncbi:MAG: hypothetical protein AB7S56_01280 [Halothiobacillaceae bacterium]
MSISVEQAKKVITDFCNTYPSAFALQFKVRETQELLYGSAATPENIGKIKGAFRPAYFSRDGEFHRGQCDVPTANIRDEDDLTRTLRHEVIGHFGINTFTADEKRRLLTAIVDSRDQPGIKQIWEKVEQYYPEQPPLIKAEEVFAFACEDIDPAKNIDRRTGERALRETCVENSRMMRLNDLVAITEHVADGMRDRSRTQQIFPATDRDQFRITSENQHVELGGQRYAVIDMDDLVQQNRRSIMGKVLAVEPDAIYTQFGKAADGRDQVVVHHPAKLDAIPALGSFASINYGANGLGKLLANQQNKTKEQQVGR